MSPSTSSAVTSGQGRLRLSAGGLYEAVPELARHDPADPAATCAALLGPPCEVADGIVLVTRYADCHALLRDPRLRRSLRLATAFEGQGSSFLIGLDPPEHTRTRSLLSAAFSPRTADAARPTIAAIVHHHLDALAGRLRVDLAAEFSRPVPLAVLCAIIGIPDADLPLIAGWSEPTSYGADLLAPPRSRPQQVAYRRALREFRSYLQTLMAARRADPGDDLVSRLVTSPGGLSDRQVLANVMGLLVAGHETTASSIGHGLLAALREPGMLARLATGGDDFAERFTEETLRLDCPIQANPRVVAEDIEVGGTRLPSGTSLILLLAAANRDPAVFPDPDRFDPDRPSSPGHLALGSGMHYCLGANLGRIETGVALQAAAQRLGSPSLVPGGVGYAPGWGLRVPDRIEVDVTGVSPQEAS